jgi:hypothetical protein
MGVLTLVAAVAIGSTNRSTLVNKPIATHDRNEVFIETQLKWKSLSSLCVTTETILFTNLPYCNTEMKSNLGTVLNHSLRLEKSTNHFGCGCSFIKEGAKLLRREMFRWMSNIACQSTTLPA